ncbi:hypothetical protein TNCV_4984771 [Trichonephila clavipes]|nr:hypothetical protein TNCV_4984771 [Trichonephila clavipes]
MWQSGKGVPAQVSSLTYDRGSKTKDSSPITLLLPSRPVLEYAAPIWAPASVSSKQKLDSIQHRASKIIIGAVSSTNNEKAEREWGLPPLEWRRNLATVEFTNKLRCYKEDHISTRVFNEWSYTKRLKRS